MRCNQWIAAVQALLAIFCFCLVFREGSCCKHGWLQYGDHCYIFYNDAKTKTMARLRCLMEGSDLVSLSDEDIFDYIKVHAASGVQGDSFWVGLQRNIEDGKLVWLDGVLVDDSQHWVQDSTDHSDDHDHFMEHINSCYAYNGAKVMRRRCYDRMESICGHTRRNKTSHMICNWGSYAKASFIGESTGLCLFHLAEETTRDGAEAACVEKGAHFQDLDGVMKDGLTVFYEHQVLTNDGSKYWTGLTWNGTHALWSSGQSLGEEFSDFIVNGTGSCIAVQFNFTGDLEIHLFQTECSELAGVICSKDPNERPTPPTQPEKPLSDGDAGLKCPSRMDNSEMSGTWKVLGDYCYWETSYETKHKTWYEAERFCQSFEGGHLASFNSSNDERVGLSFQHGKLSHPYWIGLTLDVEHETYNWSDGSSLYYNNWAPGHPDHQDKRLRCVAMDAKNVHWVSSLCGIHSWFICKVPKRVNWTETVAPKITPLQPCYSPTGESEVDLYYFEESCYFVILDTNSWHRAKQYCENEGATLVSIHSDQEMEFLLKILNEVTDDFANGGSLVWIGLNSLDTDGSFRWTDWSPVDYTYWNQVEPNSHLIQEKCCSMSVNNGQWSDDNCNAAMGFICKRKNDTSATTILPTTADPKVGNCKKGWVAHHDRCYYVGGLREKDRVNWTQALQICNENGAYLTSIRNEIDQTFLTYLLQTLRVDAWIGLHDTILKGRYYWIDNSEMQYSHWATGEPSLFGIIEDCVKMAYDRLDTGMWEDDSCDRKLGYICQTKKDPALPEPSYDRGIDCLNHEGWLKLDNTCYKMFGGNFLTWKEAESACTREGGHLVSVFDKSVRAVASYLATEVNDSFWIGLKYKESSQKLSWLNGWPMGLSFWEKNEPGNLNENTCFASTLEGYWKKVLCEEVMPYMCQITTGKPTRQKMYKGECQPTSKLWKPSSGSYCYILDNITQLDFFGAMLACYRSGSHLTSIHSMEDVESLKELMTPVMKSMFIGLYTSNKGGFQWTDDSPVDFVNWDENEPDTTKSSDITKCVEMVAETLKWRVASCNAKRQILCRDTKDTEYYEDPQSEKLVGESSKGLSTSAVTAVVIFTTIAVMVIVAAALYYSKKVWNRPRISYRQESVSFENAIYNVNAASMEFHDEPKS